MIRVVYGVLWILFSGTARLLFRLRTIGLEGVPKQGGLLIAANHASYLDIPFLGCVLPRKLSFLGRQDLFPVPGLYGLLKWLGWIPIRQDRFDRGGFGRAIELIRRGDAVVIYPEGGRSLDGRLRPGKPGIGVIVAETGCRVLPVYIDGTYQVLPVGARWPRLHPVRIVLGEPLDFSKDATQCSGKDFYRHVSRTVMARIAELGQVASPVFPIGSFTQGERSGQSPAARPFNAE